ncbi:MAG: hypothetical protein PHX40_01935, partial [Bacilli bacterium]|nr:hypothetical protein [Bacilli bacterium]
MLVEVRYVVPNNIDENSLIFLPNGYANIGKYEDLSKPIKEGYKDITHDIINKLYEGQIGLKLYAHRKYNGSFSYERNITGSRKIEGFSKIPLEQKKSIDFLKPGVYFTIIEKGAPRDNIYRIMDIVGEDVISHLNKINNDGNIVTIERIFKKSVLLQDNIVQNNREESPDGAIYNLFLQNNNKKMDVLIQAANAVEGNTIQNIAGVIDLVEKMNQVFNNLGINVTVDNSGNEFENGQYAKIITNPSEEGVQTSIILNGKKGTTFDLIHENLHIFLTVLRISDLASYERTIEAVLGQNQNEDILTREEKFVKKIVSYVRKGFPAEFIDNSAQEVMRQLHTVVKS